MKPPFKFHLQAYQQQLLQTGTRDEIIAWLIWNDPNGYYSDADSAAADRASLKLDQARDILRSQVERA